MKFAFVTCVEIGLSCMEAIYSVNEKLDLIITIQDEKSKGKSGRVYVDDFAKKNVIPVIKVNHINDQDAIDSIKNHEIDWLFIIGWSQIASKEVLESPRLGVIGAHPTLLPVGRGRAAIPWAIIKNLDNTGVSFFKMDEGVDTGLVLAQEIVPLNKDETATTLYSKVNYAHETLIVKLFKELVRNRIKGEIQDESKATYWEGRTPKDGELFFEMTIDEVDRLVRATTKPYPGAFIIRDGIKIIIWEGSKSKFDLEDNYFLELTFKDGSFYAVNYERA
jgi:methionyl-tRNA formyltransferase